MPIYDITLHKDLCIDVNAPLPEDQKVAVPPLDHLMVTLAYAGYVNLHVSDTAPTTDIQTTAWLDPNNPSFASNGVVRIYDGSAWVTATPNLWAGMITRTSGTGAVAYKRIGSEIPASGLGADGDIYYRTGGVGGVYVNAGGSWTVIPGTTAQTLTLTPALTTSRGAVELATQAEVDAGAAGVLAITPATLGAISSSSAFFTRILAAMPVNSSNVSASTLAPTSAVASGSAHIKDNGGTNDPTIFFRRGSAWVSVGNLKLA